MQGADAAETYCTALSDSAITNNYRRWRPKELMKQAKILVLDDDPDITEEMRVRLEAKGHTVLVAHEYDSGLAAIRAEKPDLLILDAMLMVNDKSGLQLPSEIRKDPSIAYLPILMITSINDGNPGQEFVPGAENENIPIDAFMNKPARSEELHKQVGILLEMKNSRWATGASK